MSPKDKKTTAQASRDITEIYCLAHLLCRQLEPKDMDNLPDPDDYSNYFLAESIRDSLAEIRMPSVS